MKILISCCAVVLALLCFGGATAFASTFTVNTTEGVTVTYKVTTTAGGTDTVQVGSGGGGAIATNTLGVVTIPATVTKDLSDGNGEKTYTVTAIGSSAFKDCIYLESVIIPEGIKKLYNDVFYNCKAMTSVTLPESLTEINAGAFGNCEALTSITIPIGVTEIKSWTFTGCKVLASITIPDGVTKIDYNAFDGCVALTSVIIPSSVTTIGTNIFNNCNALAGVTLHAVDNYTYTANNKINDATITNSKTITKITGVNGKKITNSTDVAITVTDKGATYIVVAGGIYTFGEPPAIFSVTFNSNGGSTVEKSSIQSGLKVTKPTDPTREGYTFGGWYKDSAFATAWDFDKDMVTADTTLYAKWIDTSTGAPTPVPPQAEAPATTPVPVAESAPAPAPASENIIATITSQITNATGGGMVVIPMAIPSVPTSLLEAAKGKDIDVVLDFGTYSMSINGTSIKDLPKAQRNVNLAARAISAKPLTNLSEGKSVKQMEFMQKGDFPFDLNLTVWVGNKYNGEKLTLSIYDKENNLIEEVDTAEVEDGKATFYVPKGGRYVITHE